MTLVPVQPYVLKNISLVVDVDDFAAHVSAAALVPSTKQDQLTWHGLTEAEPTAEFSESAPPETTWVLNMTCAQDWSADSLATYLLTNAGQKKTVKLVPIAGSGQPSFTVTATMVPPQIGGDYKTVQTSAVSCPVDGQPAPGVTP